MRKGKRVKRKRVCGEKGEEIEKRVFFHTKLLNHIYRGELRMLNANSEAPFYLKKERKR